jgi:hypothetical protein
MLRDNYPVGVLYAENSFTPGVDQRMDMLARGGSNVYIRNYNTCRKQQANAISCFRNSSYLW